MKVELKDNELKEKRKRLKRAIDFITKDKGLGTGTNYTTMQVAELCSQFSKKEKDHIDHLTHLLEQVEGLPKEKTTHEAGLITDIVISRQAVINYIRSLMDGEEGDKG